MLQPVYYKTTAVYFQKKSESFVRGITYNFPSFRLEESSISANTELTADSPFAWILSVYQDSQGTTTYTLAQHNNAFEIFTQLPNYWLLKILSCEKHEHVTQLQR